MYYSVSVEKKRKLKNGSEVVEYSEREVEESEARKLSEELVSKRDRFLKSLPGLNNNFSSLGEVEAHNAKIILRDLDQKIERLTLPLISETIRSWLDLQKTFSKRLRVVEKEKKGFVDGSRIYEVLTNREAIGRAQKKVSECISKLRDLRYRTIGEIQIFIDFCQSEFGKFSFPLETNETLSKSQRQDLKHLGQEEKEIKAIGAFTPSGEVLQGDPLAKPAPHQPGELELNQRLDVMQKVHGPGIGRRDPYGR